jgi:hypothetical protein
MFPGSLGIPVVPSTREREALGYKPREGCRKSAGLLLRVNFTRGTCRMAQLFYRRACFVLLPRRCSAYCLPPRRWAAYS